MRLGRPPPFNRSYMTMSFVTPLLSATVAGSVPLDLELMRAILNTVFNEKKEVSIAPWPTAAVS